MNTLVVGIFSLHTYLKKRLYGIGMIKVHSVALLRICAIAQNGSIVELLKV